MPDPLFTPPPEPDDASSPRDAGESPAQDVPTAQRAALLAALERIEQALVTLNGRADRLTRQAQHREFSAARTTGAILQAIVVGFVIAAVADWVYDARDVGPPMLKLMFAGVIQLGALTAFVVGRK